MCIENQIVYWARSKPHMHVDESSERRKSVCLYIHVHVHVYCTCTCIFTCTCKFDTIVSLCTCQPFTIPNTIFVQCWNHLACPQCSSNRSITDLEMIIYSQVCNTLVAAIAILLTICITIILHSQVTVKYVDYGNEQVIEKTKLRKPIANELFSLPFQVQHFTVNLMIVHVCLRNVVSKFLIVCCHINVHACTCMCNEVEHIYACMCNEVEHIYACMCNEVEHIYACMCNKMGHILLYMYMYAHL